MTSARLLLRNLRHFRAANLAVIAGMAVATAVLTGALLVGDSVRGSLRELAVQRLGPIDHALVATQFFGQDLASRIAAHPRFEQDFSGIHAGIMLRGGAANDAASASAAGVQIAAVGDAIAAIPPGQCIVSAALAEALAIDRPGRDLRLLLPVIDDTPRDATLARRSRTDVVSGMRVGVSRVERDAGVLSMFSLAASQRLPRNLWVNLSELQNDIGQSGRGNILLVYARPAMRGPEGAQILNEILREAARLEDYGLRIDPGPDGREAVLNSRTTYIPPAVEDAAQEAARALGVRPRRVSTYLANHVVKLADGAGDPALLHYAIVAGLSHLDDGRSLGADEVALNAWAAEQLGVQIGDRLRLDYYERQPNGDLKEVRSDRPGVELAFRVAEILPMSGLGADPSLTPIYEGLTDADSIADWRAPEGVEIDKGLVTPADERYWDEHRAAPKLFVSLEIARRLWGNPYGDINSIRVPAEQAEAFADELRRRIRPEQAGLAFRPIRAEQLQAASGSTDFSALFIGFSFFLIVAAVLLVAMLFRLSIEQRARQLGLMGALGFTPGALNRLALAEGLVLAAAGGLVGIGGALAYSWLMLTGLRTWWFSAIGTTAIRLHVHARTLLIGLVAGVAAAMLAVAWGVWRVGRSETGRLLAGGWGRAAPQRAGRRSVAMALGGVGAAAGAAMLLLGAMRPEWAQETFLAGGALLLVSSLCWVTLRLGRVVRDDSALVGWSVVRLGVRNAGRHRARSLLAAGLIAFASFVLITLSAMRQGPPENTHDRRSGTGGYQLILQADLPLLGDLNSPRGRDLLGIVAEAPEGQKSIWDRSQFTNLRTWAGQDISCLNLTRPTAPTILAVPPAMVERKAFEFARTLRPASNPWELLGSREWGERIPVIADNETASYILKLRLGDTVSITDQTGRQRELILVATLAHSIFQSELLMSEADFLRLFPTQSGFGTVLVETEAQSAQRLARLLETELEDFSVTVESTADRLQRYQDVANTYISTFQTLGAFGLLLGTVGLAVVLLRSLVERRAELALLTALGFRPGARVLLVLAENAWLLLIGLGVGAGCALLAILPTLITAARHINIPELLVTLAVVLLTGTGVLGLAVWLGGRRIAPADLRTE